METTTWFWMDTQLMFVYSLASILVYLVVQHPDLKEKVKNKILPGFAVAISSFFGLGLNCIFTMCFYVMGVGVIEIWKKRLAKKTGG